MANEVESVRQLTSEIEGCISDAEVYGPSPVPANSSISEIAHKLDCFSIFILLLCSL